MENRTSGAEALSDRLPCGTAEAVPFVQRVSRSLFSRVSDGIDSCSSIQWLRSATIGLMREALRAGIYPASNATTSSKKIMLRNVARSVAGVP